MTTTTDPTGHPAFCDPRCAHVDGDPVHVAAPFVHLALGDDVEIVAGLQRDGDGPVVVGLGIRNVASTWPDGAPVEADGVLLPCEAEVIGHRLLALAAAARAAAAVPNLPRQQGGR